MTAFEPKRGDLAFDENKGRVGRVVGCKPGLVALREPQGNLVWWTDREAIREPKASEKLSLRVAEINGSRLRGL